MKKIIILLIPFLLIIGCTKQEPKEETNTNTIEPEEIVEEEKEVYKDDNPIKLSLYVYQNSYTKRKKVTELSPTWEKFIDLCSLEVYFTEEDELELQSQKELWKKYYDNYQNIDNYKVGFNIQFDSTDGKINENLLNPEDTEKEVAALVLTYLYDDIHNSGYYSHITKEEFNDNTIISSIKLTAGGYYYNVTSDVKLTVFTYKDENDFDENNNYRGVSKYTVTIKK